MTLLAVGAMAAGAWALVLWCVCAAASRPAPAPPALDVPGSDPAHGPRVLRRGPSAVRFVPGVDDADIALHVLGRVVEVES